MGNIQTGEKNKHIIELVEAMGDSDYRKKEAQEALIEIGLPAIEQLILALKKRHEKGFPGPRKFKISCGAIEVLEKIGTPAIDPLIKSLENGDIVLRITAAWALRSLARIIGKQEFSKAVPYLIQTLHDDDSRLRYHAILALKEIGDKRAADHLFSAMNDEDLAVRNQAKLALGLIGDSRAFEPLIQALTDEHADIRYEAIICLGEIGDSRAIEPIMKTLNDPYSKVQDCAVEALEHLGVTFPDREKIVCCLGDAVEFSTVTYELNFTDRRIVAIHTIDLKRAPWIYLSPFWLGYYSVMAERKWHEYGGRSLDEKLRKDKQNFEVPYRDLAKIRLYMSLSGRKLCIETTTMKRTFGLNKEQFDGAIGRFPSIAGIKEKLEVELQSNSEKNTT